MEHITDEDFLRAFEECRISPDQFHHRDHIRLAWICLGSDQLAIAERRVADAIRTFAAHVGASQKYHETITIAWMRLVATAMEQSRYESFDEFAAANPILFDKDALSRFYSRGVLQSDTARATWVEPDLEPFECLCS